MLSSFKIKNFKSILDLEIKFDYDEGKAPNNYQELDTVVFLEPKRSKRYIPCLAIYGANASGKTNIIKAFDVFKKILLSRIDNLYIPNKLNKAFTSTFFELSFFVKNKEYTYAIEYDNEHIISEVLKQNAITLFAITPKNKDFSAIAAKGYTEQRLKGIFEVECSNEAKMQKITYLNRIATNYAGLNKELTTVFNAIIQNIEIYPINQFPFSFGMEKLAASRDYTAINESFKQITSLLQKLDIDISKMELERDEAKVHVEDKKWIIDNANTLRPIPDELSLLDDKLFLNYIYSYHKDSEGNEVKFKFREESEGTQVLAGLIGVFLSALQRGAVLIIDELERSLHPLLLAEIIRLFKDKRYNKNNAQLIFTAHNTDILDADLLRVSEVGIVRKTLKDGTKLRPVSSFDGIRNVTNFRKQYLNGAFSGIPHPYI